MCLVSHAELVQWLGVGETLDHRVEEAGVSHVIHSEAHLLLELIVHQLLNLSILSSLNIASEIVFIFLAFLPLLFELTSSFGSD